MGAPVLLRLFCFRACLVSQVCRCAGGRPSLLLLLLLLSILNPVHVWEDKRGVLGGSFVVRRVFGR